MCSAFDPRTRVYRFVNPGEVAAVAVCLETAWFEAQFWLKRLELKESLPFAIGLI